jgi:type I pantothenate kinase
VLSERGILNRKGFPESYDARAITEFLRDLKSGVAEVHAPVYSHVHYDVVPNEHVTVRQPDILIFEGINVLQVATGSSEFVSDYFDFSIFIDAAVVDIERWYVQRFLRLRETVFQSPDSYFRNYASLTLDEAVATAKGIWQEINGKNLVENILPTRERASLILEMGPDHAVNGVRLRKL